MEVGFVAGAKYENDIVFSAMLTNALMRMDCQSGQIELLGFFDNEKIKMGNHRCAVKYGEELWFVPWEGQCISCVDLRSYRIIFQKVVNEEQYGFVDTLVYDKHYLFLIPNGYGQKNLFKVDMETYEVIMCGTVLPPGLNVCAGAYYLDDKLFFLSSTGEVLSTYDVISGYIEIIGRGALEGYHSLIRSENEVWLIPWEKKEIERLELSSGRRTAFQLTEENDMFDCAMETEDQIIIFPFDQTRKILRIDKQNGSIMEKEAHITIDKGRWLHIRRIPSEASEYWVSTSFGELWQLDQKGEIMKRFNCRISEEVENQLLSGETKNGALKELLSREIDEKGVLGGLKAFICLLPSW